MRFFLSDSSSALVAVVAGSGLWLATVREDAANNRMMCLGLAGLLHVGQLWLLFLFIHTKRGEDHEVVSETMYFLDRLVLQSELTLIQIDRHELPNRWPQGRAERRCGPAFVQSSRQMGHRQTDSAGAEEESEGGKESDLWMESRSLLGDSVATSADEFSSSEISLELEREGGVGVVVGVAGGKKEEEEGGEEESMSF